MIRQACLYVTLGLTGYSRTAYSILASLLQLTCQRLSHGPRQKSLDLNPALSPATAALIMALLVPVTTCTPPVTGPRPLRMFWSLCYILMWQKSSVPFEMAPGTAASVLSRLLAGSVFRPACSVSTCTARVACGSTVPCMSRRAAWSFYAALCLTARSPWTDRYYCTPLRKLADVEHGILIQIVKHTARHM